MIKIRAKLWTRNFIIITIINFLIALNFLFLIFIISEFGMHSFAASPSEAGFAASIFIIGAVIARFITGLQIARLGYKKMLWLGLLAGFVMTLAYFAVDRLALLYIVRFFHGATFGVATNAAATIVADIIPAERRGEGIGYFSLSQPLATAVGPFLVIYLSRYGGYALIFSASAIASGIALLMVFFLSIRNIKYGAEKIKATAGIKLGSLFELKVIPVAAICLLVFICYSSIMSFLKVYTKEIGLADAAGFFFMVYAAVVLITRPFLGRLLDAKGENVIMYPAIMLMAAGMFLVARSDQGHMLLLAAVLLAVGVGSIQISTQTIVVKMVPRHRLGVANSSYLMFYDIGHGIGPVTAGFLIPHIGYRGMYSVMALISLSCILFYYFLHGKKAARLAHLPVEVQARGES